MMNKKIDKKEIPFLVLSDYEVFVQDCMIQAEKFTN